MSVKDAIVWATPPSLVMLGRAILPDMPTLQLLAGGMCLVVAGVIAGVRNR